MPPDLPASLVVECLDWIACDECGGTGLIRCVDDFGMTAEEDACFADHIVVVHEGRRIYADPGRMETICDRHRHPSEGCNGEWPGCRLVLRPEIPLDLEEA